MPDTTGFTSPLAAPGGTYTPFDIAPSGGAAAETGAAGRDAQRGPRRAASPRAAPTPALTGSPPGGRSALGSPRRAARRARRRPGDATSAGGRAGLIVGGGRGRGRGRRGGGGDRGRGVGLCAAAHRPPPNGSERSSDARARAAPPDWPRRPIGPASRRAPLAARRPRSPTRPPPAVRAQLSAAQRSTAEGAARRPLLASRRRQRAQQQREVGRPPSRHSVPRRAGAEALALNSAVQAGEVAALGHLRDGDGVGTPPGRGAPRARPPSPCTPGCREPTLPRDPSRPLPEQRHYSRSPPRSRRTALRRGRAPAGGTARG